MRTLPRLFENNRAWAAARLGEDPHFFARLLAQQAPEFHWIGCSDSRVPANQIVGLGPGEMFVHRNVANLVLSSDMNGLSALQFAVERLGVRHVIVCGHYGCAGVRAAFEDHRLGLVDNWLRSVRSLVERHAQRLATLPSDAERLDRVCELNVIEQVRNACFTTVVQDAWRAGRPLSVHGWIYDVADGLLRDLGLCVSSAADLDPLYRQAVDAAGVRGGGPSRSRG